MLERRKKEYQSVVVITSPEKVAQYWPLDGVRLVTAGEFLG